MPADPVRDAAVDVLYRVFERGMYLDQSLDRSLRRKKISGRGRRFLTQLVYGTVRYRLLCDYVLSGLCTQPLDQLPPHILIILRMGVFQALFCDQVTFPAMVHTAVDLGKKRGHAGLGRLVNAVLRKAPKQIEDVRLPEREADPVKWLSLRYAMPKWLVRLLIEETGGSAAAEACCQTMNTPAPAMLRVNTLKTDRDTLVRRLLKAGIEAAPFTELPDAVTVLDGAGALPRSKWFTRGHCTIQDPASMLAAYLLEPEGGERVCDLCAAPGGKTSHLAERTGGEAHIVAADSGLRRLQALLDTLDRLETPGVTVVCADGKAPPFSEETFDCVLVDAPCSGLGTLRRHPDLKWRMDPEAIERLHEEQAALLRSAVRLCKNGGRIVYAVCTFTQRETRDIAGAFPADGPVRPEDGPELLQPWKTATGEYRIPPSSAALDGFYLIRLRKVS
jgi:16S rRNA (cytosine967-C5)-methyltransferase